MSVVVAVVAVVVAVVAVVVVVAAAAVVVVVVMVVAVAVAVAAAAVVAVAVEAVVVKVEVCVGQQSARFLKLSTEMVCIVVREVQFVQNNKLVKVLALKQRDKKVIVYIYWRYEC